MQKQEKMAFVATIAFAIGIMGFVFGGYSEDIGMNITMSIVKIFATMTTVGFIIANLALAISLLLKKNHSRFIWDDVAFTSVCVLVFGVLLGIITLLIGTCASMHELMIDAMKVPTVGMSALALFGVGIYFAGYALNEAYQKDYWTALQSLGTASGVGAIALGALCGGGLLPENWLPTCGYITIVSMIIALVAVIIPDYRQKMQEKEFRRKNKERVKA